MSTNNRERRAAKRKDRLRRASGGEQTRWHGGRRVEGFAEPPPEFEPGRFGRQDAIDLLARLVPVVSRPEPQAELLAVVEVRLLADYEEHLALLDEIATLRFMAILGNLWENGWQPADLLHVVRRFDDRLVDLAGAVIAEQSRRALDQERMPAAWRDQLELAAEAGGSMRAVAGQGWLVVAVQRRHRCGRSVAWLDALRLIGVWQDLPRMPLLMDPPSRWRLAGTQARQHHREHSENRMLAKIRALLAKAEATTHAAEAEIYTAKAQELMTRHSIDACLLDAGAEQSVDTVAVRVHLLNPYTEEKAQLLNAVAAANRCRTVLTTQLALATLIGTPVDVDQSCMLFTSLLVQATAAVAEAGTATRTRSRSFRRGFLAAYAARIGERLREANETTTASYGAELVPVLRRQSEAIDAQTQRLFPHLVSRSTSYDARGWEAGRAAADRAALVAGALRQ